MSWTLTPLSEFVTIQKGKKHETVELASQNSQRFIQIDDLRNDKNIKYTDDSKGVLANIANVIIAWDGANAGTIGFGKSGFIGSTLAKLSFDINEVDTEYLGRFLQSKFRELRENCTGATIPHISKRHLISLEIPLPPLETQKQIAAVLEKADQLRKDCQQMEQELNSLTQSVFIDMFGDPVTNPKGWDLAVLSDVVKNIQGGKSPKCDSRPAGANEWGVLKLSAVTGGFYKPNQNKAILEGTLPNSDIELKQGDLLFTRKNTYELVGACAYVRETPDRLMLPDLIFRFHMPEKLKIYFWGLLNNTSFKLKVRALASGAAGSMPNIAKSKLNMLELPLPSDKAVLSYTNAIQEIWEQQIILKQLLSSYQEQFDVLMQKAFKGELTL
ncbi:restriction endonuclease subunit S [Vibrio splendidus]